MSEAARKRTSNLRSNLQGLLPLPIFPKIIYNFHNCAIIICITSYIHLTLLQVFSCIYQVQIQEQCFRISIRGVLHFVKTCNQKFNVRYVRSLVISMKIDENRLTSRFKMRGKEFGLSRIVGRLLLLLHPALLIGLSLSSSGNCILTGSADIETICRLNAAPERNIMSVPWR